MSVSFAPQPDLSADTSADRGEVQPDADDVDPPCRHCDGTGTVTLRTDVDDERDYACEHCNDSDDGPDADRDDADGDGWAKHMDTYDRDAVDIRF